MVTEQNVTLRVLTPDVEGNWLYKEEAGERIYSQRVYLGVEADPAEWHECTEEEKDEDSEI